LSLRRSSRAARPPARAQIILKEISAIPKYESNDSFVSIGEVLMQTITANEAKTRFGELIDRVQREPVRVTRRNRIVGVMVSAEDYAAMRDFYADRLARTLRETASEAARKGLTESELERLLADEG
jgi:prevent-host-death family protein